jgi:hypothetical protein
MKLQHPGQVSKRWPHAMSSADAEGVVNLCKSSEENGRYWDTPHAVAGADDFHIPTEEGPNRERNPNSKSKRNKLPCRGRRHLKSLVPLLSRRCAELYKHVVRAAAERHGVLLRCPTGSPASRLGCDGIGCAVTGWGGARGLHETPAVIAKNAKNTQTGQVTRGGQAKSLCSGVGCEGRHPSPGSWNRKPSRNPSGICG